MPSGLGKLSFVQKDPPLQSESVDDQVNKHELECISSADSTLRVGVRVVRGTDWLSDDIVSDGGEGFVGTIVEVGRNSTRVHESTAVIQWDMGTRGVYRAGCDGHFDLCVLDSSSAGKKITLFAVFVVE